MLSWSPMRTPACCCQPLHAGTDGEVLTSTSNELLSGGEYRAPIRYIVFLHPEEKKMQKNHVRQFDVSARSSPEWSSLLTSAGAKGDQASCNPPSNTNLFARGTHVFFVDTKHFAAA